jgi:hypothetical protein
LQALEQVPQLALSVCSLTQAPLQDVRLALQTQAPLTQEDPVPHDFPQRPQFAGSLIVFTQVPLQFVGSDESQVHIPSVALTRLVSQT